MALHGESTTPTDLAKGALLVVKLAFGRVSWGLQPMGWDMGWQKCSPDR